MPSPSSVVAQRRFGLAQTRLWLIPNNYRNPVKTGTIHASVPLGFYELTVSLPDLPLVIFGDLTMSSAPAKNFVGIDLGTTLSVVAYLGPNGSISTIPNSDGEPLTNSAIYIDGTHVVVGRVAKEAAGHMPNKVATYVKRDMGKSLYSRLVDGRSFRPETLSAMIIRKLKQDAERRIGPIRRAAITVPAYFDDARRKATEDAGRIAGLEVVDILNEPTAAALAYCLEGHLNRDAHLVQPDFPDGKLTALVYDLGGGTFDVTTIQLRAKQIDTIATDGAVKLGGKDWDDRIVELVVAQFKSQFGLDVPAEQRFGIANKAETAKKLLSQLPIAEIEHAYRDRTVRLTLTRDQFVEQTRDLLAQTEVITNLIIKQSRLKGSDRPLTWEEIDRVLLVGGSTRMPMVRDMLRRITGKEPDRSLDPDQVVARGAAIFASIQAARQREGQLELDDRVVDELSNMGISDVNAHSLGVEAFSKKQQKLVNAIVIPKNHPLPCAISRVFPLRTASASEVRVKVLEGEAPDPSANFQLGECHVTDLPPNLPSGAPIQVRLSYERDGRVRVMALDMTGGRYAHAEIERTGGLSEADIRREMELLDRFQIQ
jgi:molecular chaperone DnaK